MGPIVTTEANPMIATTSSESVKGVSDTLTDGKTFLKITSLNE